KFFDRKEIQDVIAYLRAVANKRDNAAIERIINFPVRGIGDATVEKLDQHARTQSVSIFQILMELDRYETLLGKGIVKKVESFARLMSEIDLQKSLPVDKFVEFVIDKVGFKDVYSASKKEEDITRWENIQQFITYAKEYTAKNDDPTLEGFLETVTLEESGKDDEPMDRNKVTIATMHAVKGLEFRAVFIVGCEEDTFPSALAKKGGELEEERRIMYVAITRAKERLYISNAQRRFRFGRLQDCLPSRFIAEATGKSEDAYKTFGERKAYVENRGARPDYLGDEPVSTRIRESFATRPRVEVKPQIAKPQVKDLTGFVGGAKVRHPNYGEGTILVVLGEGKNATATVAFPNLGVKKFIISLAPLTLVK
ncbi:MAG: ATP-binding domain-containing protein, partial [Clostridia bacterium]|nr:ATP-binding domain-containing protein [Clostridia bacterium]